MVRRLLAALGVMTVLWSAPALAARPVAVIQADITATTLQLTAAQLDVTKAQAALTVEQADIPPIQAKLTALNIELAAAQTKPSPVGTSATPGLGQIVDKNGTFWVVKADGKIYRTPGGVVTSSGGVKQLVVVDGGLLKQYNGRDWWTQPLDGSAGVITTAPGTQPPVDPPVTPTGKGPISGWTKTSLHDTFANLDNWTRTFPGGGPTGSYSYGYGNRGLSNGQAIDPWFVCNPLPAPNGYPPALGMEDPVKLQPGGGVRLDSYKNPRWSTGLFKTPDGPADQGKWCGAWLWTKAPLTGSFEVTTTFTLNPWAGNVAVGSWPAIWLISNKDWSEIDILDGLMANPTFPGRAWYAAGVPGGWNMCGGSCPLDGNIKPGKNTISLKLTPDAIVVMFNGVIVRTVSQPNAFRQPLYLGIQEVGGGWDGNNNQALMAPRTSTLYDEVDVYVP